MSSRFDDIRPYFDEEISAAMNRIIGNKSIEAVAKRFYPAIPVDELKKTIAGLNDIESVQKTIMYPIIKQITETSTSSFTYSGLEKLDPKKAYLFVSNHRDIILDAAFLQAILCENNFPMSDITFGRNLMVNQFVIDIGKSNRMFIVERGGSKLDIYRNSLHLSEYIRDRITNLNYSIWIAQRNGRTKDGIDKTESGVLRMFGMSGSKNFVDNFSELNIVPISISFEYEPCDFMKTNELYHKELHGSYTKATDEDLQSMLIGISINKGAVNIHINDIISREELENIASKNPKTPINDLLSLMDSRILGNYKLAKTNYMAYDILHNKELYSHFYSPEDKSEFIIFMESQLSKIKEKNPRIREIFLGIYANPVKNSLKYGGVSKT